MCQRTGEPKQNLNREWTRINAKIPALGCLGVPSQSWTYKSYWSYKPYPCRNPGRPATLIFASIRGSSFLFWVTVSPPPSLDANVRAGDNLGSYAAGVAQW